MGNILKRSLLRAVVSLVSGFFFFFCMSIVPCPKEKQRKARVSLAVGQRASHAVVAGTAWQQVRFCWTSRAINTAQMLMARYNSTLQGLSFCLRFLIVYAITVRCPSFFPFPPPTDPTLPSLHQSPQHCSCPCVTNKCFLMNPFQAAF